MGTFTAPALYQKLKPGRESIWDLLKQPLIKARLQEQLTEAWNKNILVIDQREDFLHRDLRKFDVLVWLDFDRKDRKQLEGLFEFLSEEQEAPLCVRVKDRPAMRLLLATVQKHGHLPQKVLAYVLHPQAQDQALLVCKKEGEDNIEVIRGRVDQGETPGQSLLREIKEESGLRLKNPRRFYFESIITDDKGMTEFQLHHCYVLHAPKKIPESWTHKGTGQGLDRGTRFHYTWLPMSMARIALDKEMREPLNHLLSFLRQSRETISLAPRLNVKYDQAH